MCLYGLEIFWAPLCTLDHLAENKTCENNKYVENLKKIYFILQKYKKKNYKYFNIIITIINFTLYNQHENHLCDYKLVEYVLLYVQDNAHLFLNLIMLFDKHERL